MSLISITKLFVFNSLDKGISSHFVFATPISVETIFSPTIFDFKLPDKVVKIISFLLLSTALFASEVGLIYGQTETFIMHLVAILLVVIYTLGMSYLLFKLVNLITPLRVREDQEERGLDASQHGEYFY